ncbi:MAG: hypothetical protein AB7O59_22075, partial [Pirellulales bacterium]
PRVPLPLRLRLRSSGTREPKSKQRYPNPYLHNPWYRKSRLVTRTPEEAESVKDGEGVRADFEFQAQKYLLTYWDIFDP